MMVSESKGSGASVDVVVTVADAEAALPSEFVYFAVIVH